MKVAVRVKDMRPGSGYADAWFTTVIGYEDDAGTFEGLVGIRDCELRTSKAQEQYIKFPARPRIRKNPDGDTATYQKGTDGATIYDQVVDSVLEKYTDKAGEEKWGPTRVAKAFKDKVTAIVVQEWASTKGEAAGRGAAAPAPKKATPKTASSTGGAERGSPVGGNELPF
jgi:hypothetical protein